MTIKPELMTIADALHYTGFSRTRLYLEMPKLDVRKAGRRVMIGRKSLDVLMDALPRARTRKAWDHR